MQCQASGQVSFTGGLGAAGTCTFQGCFKYEFFLAINFVHTLWGVSIGWCHFGVHLFGQNTAPGHVQGAVRIFPWCLELYPDAQAIKHESVPLNWLCSFSTALATTACICHGYICIVLLSSLCPSCLPIYQVDFAARPAPGSRCEQQSLTARLQSYGYAGVASYGLLNTVYYITAFIFFWTRVAKVPKGESRDCMYWRKRLS